MYNYSYEYTGDLYVDKAKKWRWRLWARNGRLVADSGKGYRRKQTALRMFNRIFGTAWNLSMLLTQKGTSKKKAW